MDIQGLRQFVNDLYDKHGIMKEVWNPSKGQKLINQLSKEFKKIVIQIFQRVGAPDQKPVKQAEHFGPEKGIEWMFVSENGRVEVREHFTPLQWDFRLDGKEVVSGAFPVVFDKIIEHLSKSST